VLYSEQSLLCLKGHCGYDSHTAIRLLTLLFQLVISGFRQSKYLNAQSASSVTIEITTTNNSSSTRGSAEAKLWITHLFFTYSYEKEFKSGQQSSTFPSYLEDAQPDKISADAVRRSPSMADGSWGVGSAQLPWITGSTQPAYHQPRFGNPLEAKELYECCELIFLLLYITNPYVSESSLQGFLLLFS